MELKCLTWRSKKINNVTDKMERSMKVLDVGDQCCHTWPKHSVLKQHIILLKLGMFASHCQNCTVEPRLTTTSFMTTSLLLPFFSGPQKSSGIPTFIFSLQIYPMNATTSLNLNATAWERSQICVLYPHAAVWHDCHWNISKTTNTRAGGSNVDIFYYPIAPPLTPCSM